MPRRSNRIPEPEPLDLERALAGRQRAETRRDGVWNVQPQSAASAVKVYLCPGCGEPAAPELAVTWGESPACVSYPDVGKVGVTLEATGVGEASVKVTAYADEDTTRSVGSGTITVTEAGPAELVFGNIAMIPHAGERRGMQHLRQQRRNSADHHRGHVSVDSPGNRVRRKQGVIGSRYGRFAIGAVVETVADLLDHRGAHGRVLRNGLTSTPA